MPIFHWMLKASSNSCSRSQREQCKIQEKVETLDRRSEDIEQQTKSVFTVLLRREDSRACFSNTLQLKHLNSLKNCCEEERSRSCIGPVGMAHKCYDPVVSMGCKARSVMCGVGPMGSSRSGPGPEREAQKRRTEVSSMKELIRWAAAVKTPKGGMKRWKVLYLRNKMALKGTGNDTITAGSSNTTNRISFRWDVGSCSTSSSSAISPLSINSSASKLSDETWSNKKTSVFSNSAVTTFQRSSNSDASRKSEGCSRAGQWITSDSEYVVLEL